MIDTFISIATGRRAYDVLTEVSHVLTEMSQVVTEVSQTPAHREVEEHTLAVIQARHHGFAVMRYGRRRHNAHRVHAESIVTERLRRRLHACMQTYIHTDIHTYIHTYMHTYIHTYMHTYMHTCIHTYLVNDGLH